MTHHMFPPMASGTWQGRGNKSPVLWKVSLFAELTSPSWWILVPSWRSSSCPSSPSSSACPRPCASCCLPILMGSWCPLVCLACWGHYFLPNLPSPIDPPSRDDCRAAPRCSIRRVDLWDVVHSSGLAIAPTPGCIGWAVWLPLLGFVLASPRCVETT